jgi:hypothetical protein
MGVHKDRRRVLHHLRRSELNWRFSSHLSCWLLKPNIRLKAFCPRSDFCLELVPRLLADGSIAILQTPQYFRSSKEQTWVERGAGSFQEMFYRFIQVKQFQLCAPLFSEIPTLTRMV